MGTQYASPQWGRSSHSQFSAHFYCGKTAGCISMPLGIEVGLSPRDFVLHGDPAPLPKRRQSPGAPPPNFRPMSIVAKLLDGWKMVLGMEVGLGQVHIVLDADTAPLPKKGVEPPIFGPSLLWPNGCMDQDATWYGGRRQPTQYCVRCRPSYPQKKGTTTPTQFWPMSIVAKWLDGWRRRLVRQ